MRQRLLTVTKKDYIALTKSGSSIVLVNERTKQQLTLPKDASPHEIREGRLTLQEQDTSDPLLRQRAGDVMDRLTGAKPTEVDNDPEPYVPVGGSRNSPYVLKAEKLHAEWQARRTAETARATELRTQDMLVEKLAERLKAEPKPTEQPADDSGLQYLPEGLRGSFDDFKRQADANAQGGTDEDVR